MVMLNAEMAKSEDDFSGNARPLPGRYHVAIIHAEEKGSKKKGTPGLELEFKVIVNGLAPDNTVTSGQADRTIPLFLSFIGGDDSKTQTCINRVIRLALCCGVLRPGEAKEPDWSEALGRELVIEVENQEYESDGKTRNGSQISFLGFWSLGNKEVANVPKDPKTAGMLQLAKAGGPVNHPVPTPPVAAAATAPKGRFSEL